MNILCAEFRYTHNTTLLFGTTLLKHGRHVDYWNRLLNMRMRVCWSWIVLLPSDTNINIITSITAVLLPFVIYLFTFPRSNMTGGKLCHHETCRRHDDLASGIWVRLLRISRYVCHSVLDSNGTTEIRRKFVLRHNDKSIRSMLVHLKYFNSSGASHNASVFALALFTLRIFWNRTRPLVALYVCIEREVPLNSLFSSRQTNVLKTERRDTFGLPLNRPRALEVVGCLR
jgi:hypothetical protein